MVQSTLEKPKSGTRNSNPIVISPDADQARIAADKNVILNYTISPTLANHLYGIVAGNADNVVSENGLVTLQRTKLASYLRQAVSTYSEFSGEQLLPSKKGKQLQVNHFRSNVEMIFNTARAMAQFSNMTEEQTKANAFAMAKQMVVADAAAKEVVIDDSTLESIWSGSSVDVEIEDDDDDDEDVVVA